MLVKIRMKTLMAGPKGVRNTGEVVEVPKAEADALCPVFAERLETPPIIGKGADDEVILPLNQQVFASIAEGIHGVDLAKSEDATVTPEPPEPEDEQPEDADPESEEEPEGAQPEDEFPKHVGGGYYILPDGSKIHGKQAALDALAELSRGD
jgi:hypothetical protein